MKYDELPEHVKKAINKAEQNLKQNTIEIGAPVQRQIKKPEPVLPVPTGIIVQPKWRSKLESRYAKEILEPRKFAGEIAWWLYEGITLKLADDTRYTPDFCVLLSSGEFQLHETKGFMRDSARVKLNVAAKMFPFPFILVRLEKGVWDYKRV